MQLKRIVRKYAFFVNEFLKRQYTLARMRKNFFKYVISCKLRRFDCFSPPCFVKEFKIYESHEVFKEILPICKCKPFLGMFNIDKFFGKGPYPFNVKFFYDPNVYDVFVEIGSGHGEIASSWVYKMNTNPKFNLNFRKKHFGNNTSSFDSGLFSPKLVAVITFEWHKRFWRKTRERILLHCLNNNTGNVGNNKLSDNTSYPCCYAPSLAFWDNGYTALKIFSKSSIAGIFVLFPDPWHKRKHKKRRPLTVDFFKQAYKILRNGGFILIVTDHSEYFTFIQEQAYDFIELMANKNKQPPLLQAEEVSSLKELGLVATHYYKKWKRKGLKKFFAVRIQKIDD